jgi:hypothetical protein
MIKIKFLQLNPHPNSNSRFDYNRLILYFFKAVNFDFASKIKGRALVHVSRLVRLSLRL